MFLVAAQVVVTREGRRIVDGASLQVGAGAVVTIQGASGSGKSTFLRALAWLIPIDGGTILLDGKSPREHGVLSYRRHVAYVPQLPRMFEGTVADNLAAGPRYRGASSSDRIAIDRKLLDQVGLPHDMAPRSAADLSGGERLRVALARALANEPSLLLLDEPTSALDPQAAQVVLSTLAALSAGGTAIVAVTHAETHAQKLGGERYRMSSGFLRHIEPEL